MLARSQFKTEEEYLAALRDYFAAAALTGFLAADLETTGKTSPQEDIEALARVSYKVSDAMLAERRKP